MGRPKLKRIKCSIDGCNGFTTLEYCKKHKTRFYRYGTTDPLRGTLPHKIRILDKDTAEIKGFIFDLRWAEMLKWAYFHDDGKGYARVYDSYSGKTSKSVPIANIILDKKRDDTVVDHINGNTRDNRCENLRILTRLENSRNRVSNPMPEFIGKRKGNQWLARLTHKRQRIYIGYFPTEQDAKNAIKEELIKRNARFREELYNAHS